jgi:PIF1-like helicase
VPGWMNDDTITHEFNQSDVLDGLDDILVDNLPAEDIEIDNQQSQRFQQQIKSMSITKLIMTQLGWTAHQPETLPDDCVSTSYESVSGICIGSEWKNVVASKRQGILESWLQSYQDSRPTDAPHSSGEGIFQGVKIIDQGYLEKKCVSPDWQAEMDSVAKLFHLNAEQERAFHIVANHSCHPTSEKLKMHIGGMGGTGKSQVLKALMEFFKCKKESHQFIIVAPTGSAAALLGGSTYHYMFGINDFASSKSANLQLADDCRGLTMFLWMRCQCYPARTFIGSVKDLHG